MAKILYLHLIFFLWLIAFVPDSQCLKPCAPRDYGKGSVVCVCNASYCDDLDLRLSTSDDATAYISSKDGGRFHQIGLNFTQNSSSGSGLTLRLNPDKKYQKILGFGGAFTDAACMNILSLEENLQDEILSAYYSPKGLEYNMGRVPMASCDFSTHVYSYDDVPNDFNLTHFNLTVEDVNYKIPLIKRAQTMMGDREPLLIFGSPWSSPGWMKTSGKMQGRGWLKDGPGSKYYDTWAQYFVKFLQEYEKRNLTLWGLTAQNEPLSGFVPFYSFQALGFTWTTQRKFVEDHLGPALEAAGFGPDKIKLMIGDDNRFILPMWAQEILKSPRAHRYVAGTAVHWYWNGVVPVEVLDITNKMHPDKFILSTEACISGRLWDYVSLGNWDRAEDYAYDILEDLLHWTVGWVDWNLALDLNGGPNWARNFVDSPVIVNKTNGEFYKQPTYYILGHFAKFLKPGSVRIGSELSWDWRAWNMHCVAFETPDNKTVVVVLNKSGHENIVSIDDPRHGILSIRVAPHSIQTLIWRS